MDFYEKYSFIFEDEKLYSSPVWRESYTNYRNRGSNDPLEMLVDAFGTSIKDAFIYAAAYKNVEKAIRDVIINSGGEWTDD